MLTKEEEYTQELEQLSKLPTGMLAVQPLTTLTEDKGMVLLIAESDYTTTEYVAYVGKRDHTGRFVNHAGDSIAGEYGTKVIAWMPLPFTKADVEIAVSRGAHAVSEDVQRLHDQIKAFVTNSTSNQAPRQVLAKIHSLLDNEIPNDLPHGQLTPEIRLALLKVSEWMVEAEDEKSLLLDIQYAFRP